MHNPLISIVICCHNRRDYLRLTLDSVLKQSYRPIEVIVVDDGSTDNTQELFTDTPDYVKYHWQPGQGIAHARTVASKMASGEYIAYQDDDDLMPAHRITRLYEELQRHPEAVFATGDYALIDPDGRLTGERWFPAPLEHKGSPVLMEDAHEAILWPKVPAVPHTTLFRREYGEKIGWFDTTFKYACSDADFLARLGRLGPLVYLPEVVSYYRRGHSAIWKDIMRASYSRLQLWGKHMPDPGTNDPLRHRLQERIAAALRTIASHKVSGNKIDNPEFEDFADKARELLDGPLRFKLWLYESMQLPVRRIVYSFQKPSAKIACEDKN